MNDDGRHQTARSSIFDEAVVGKKGILVASTFDTHFKWKIFDIFDSSLRLALTFDIHTRTRRVPLGFMD
jgi:hypothetical protein